MNKDKTLIKARALLEKYKNGELGDTTMPEDTHPILKTTEEKLLYYTLPMALNYQRNSFKLWEAAKKTWEDPETSTVFNLKLVSKNPSSLASMLLKHRLALQPNKHPATWLRISQTISENWGTISNLLNDSDNDFVHLREIVQKSHKKGFPYLSGPKIFNYWSYIITEYCGVTLTNRSLIEIAPDTHVIQASIKLGVISLEESQSLSREAISLKWREILKNSGIDPIDLHSPLWFWSRGGFALDI